MFLKCQPVQEPEKMTQIIVEALEKTGQRGIINKGWGGLGNCKFLVPWHQYDLIVIMSCVATILFPFSILFLI